MALALMHPIGTREKRFGAAANLSGMWGSSAVPTRRSRWL